MDDRQLKRILEEIIRGSQGNADHLSGEAREFARKFNLLADDVATLYDILGIQMDDQADDSEPSGSVSLNVDHDELEGVSADDHHNQVHLLWGTDHSDVDTTDTPADGEVITWDAAGSKWVSSPADAEGGGRSPKRGYRPPALYIQYDVEDPAFMAVPGGTGSGGTGPAGADGAAGAQGSPGFVYFEDPDALMWVPSVVPPIAPETFANTISAAIAANTNDWAPTGYETASVIRVTMTGSKFLTGLVGGTDGKVVVIQNITSGGGAATLTLSHLSGSSAAANQFRIQGAADLDVGKGEQVFLIYDGTSAVWRVGWIGGSTGSAGVDGANGVPGIIYHDEADFIIFPGPAGAAGTPGADGAPGSGGGGAGSMPALIAEEVVDYGMPMPPARDQVNVVVWSSRRRVGAGAASDRIYLPYEARILEVYFVLPASSSATATIDVKKNGTSIFSGTFPTLTSGFISNYVVPVTQTYSRDDYLTVHVTNPGNAGGRLKAFIVTKRI